MPDKGSSLVAKSASEEDFRKLPIRDDNPSSVDLLGFGDIVSAIEATITREDLNPITVGVNAPWGGGKTTVLQLLQQALQERQDVIDVYVSPWEFDRNTDTKAALIGAVLERLEETIKGQRSTGDAVYDTLKKLRQRINVTKAVKIAAVSSLTMSLPSVNDLVSVFSDGESGADPTLQGFRDQFAGLLASDSLAEIARVVVLVDDLDRSLPDTVVESLEAIKLFLSVEKMAFVIAADEENVARAVGQRLASTGQPVTARQYLEKIVHIPFRIPALSRELTEEYLLLLMLPDRHQMTGIVDRLSTTRGESKSLPARVGDLVGGSEEVGVRLAERLAPILHRHTLGNPRRLKRFLNALWMRTAFAAVRGVQLDADACAKLMVAELLYPDLFSQMIGWLASDTLASSIEEIETGAGDYAQQTFEWGQLEPPLREADLSSYLHLAASLRGDTVEEAVLQPGLRLLARDLAGDSVSVRNSALKTAAQLEVPEKSTLARYLAVQLRHQTTPERQKALAEAISGLTDDGAVAKTVAEELLLMPAKSILTPVPLAVLAKTHPPEVVEVVRGWSQSAEVPGRTRKAAVEALKGVE